MSFITTTIHFSDQEISLIKHAVTILQDSYEGGLLDNPDDENLKELCECLDSILDKLTKPKIKCKERS